jgi:hypothetical protein
MEMRRAPLLALGVGLYSCGNRIIGERNFSDWAALGLIFLVIVMVVIGFIQTLKIKK